MDDDKPTEGGAEVLSLPVKFKAPAPEDRSLVFLHEVPRRQKCEHWNATFIVDEKTEGVECSRCGERLNPMWVLKMLCAKEAQWHETRARYQDEMKRLGERSRTKCQHCGEMTRISKR